MTDRFNSKRTNSDEADNNNGVAEKIITSDDMKKYKNAYDVSRSYVSGDEDWSSSSHRFSELNNK